MIYKKRIQLFKNPFFNLDASSMIISMKHATKAVSTPKIICQIKVKFKLCNNIVLPIIIKIAHRAKSLCFENLDTTIR